MKQFERTERLIGKDGQNKLTQSHVAVFGLGGVGSYVVEALTRAGIGKLTIVDFDVVDETNLNRQLFALHSTIGQHKTDIAKARIADINPKAEVVAVCARFEQSTQCMFDFSAFDYVVDAIDTVSSKLLLAEICFEKDIPIISCMGTGNKLDPTAFKVADISRTTMCPLAKVMRRELKKRGVTRLKVVYSEEIPAVQQNNMSCDDLSDTRNVADMPCGKRKPPSSISFVPPTAGMILAGEAIKDLLKR